MSKIEVVALVHGGHMAKYVEDSGFTLAAVSQKSPEHALVGLGYTMVNGGVTLQSAAALDEIELEQEK
jgi:hypothetical protein